MPERQALAFSDRWRDWRNRLVADPAFQRWAARLPFVRRIADAAREFAVRPLRRLRLFAGAAGLRARGPVRAARGRPAGRGGPVPAVWPRARRACDACWTPPWRCGLLERRAGGRYGLGELGAAMLGNPGVAAMVEHHALLYADLADPVALLRQRSGATRLAGHWPYATAGAPQSLRRRAGTRLLARSWRHRSRWWPARCSTPTTSAGTAACWTSAAATALSRRGRGAPPRPAAACCSTCRPWSPWRDERLRPQAWGRGSRRTGGDFTHDPLPVGADVVSLIRVLHDHDDAGRAGAAGRGAPGAAAGRDAGDRRADRRRAGGGARWATPISVCTCWRWARGRPRSAQHCGNAAAGGLRRRPRRSPTARPLLTGVLTARNPSAESL